MGGKLRTAMNIMPFRDGRTENVVTFVFDHPTCGEKVGDYIRNKTRSERVLDISWLLFIRGLSFCRGKQVSAPAK